MDGDPFETYGPKVTKVLKNKISHFANATSAFPDYFTCLGLTGFALENENVIFIMY